MKNYLNQNKKNPLIVYPSPFIIINPADTFYPSPDNSLIYEREAYNYETYWALQAKAIVVNLNSLSSIGTAQELMLANTNTNYCPKIIGFIEKDKFDKLHPWNQMACTTVHTYDPKSLDDILKRITYIILGYSGR